MSGTIHEQIEHLRGAAAGFDVTALRHKIQAYRERNFQGAQIKMLHAWWRVKGASRMKGRVAQSRSAGNGRGFRSAGFR